MSTRGPALLREWMDRHDIKPPAIAAAVGVSKASVYGWLKGEYRPDHLVRAKLERWTDGIVAIDDWDTAAEAYSLATLQPFEATGTDGR